MILNFLNLQTRSGLIVFCVFKLQRYIFQHLLTRRENRHVWRACNLASFTPCLTGPVDYPFASCHEGPGFEFLGGYLRETGILLLALSRYIGDLDVIRSLASLPFSWCFTRLRADNV
jgi:hypothetical protein